MCGISGSVNFPLDTAKINKVLGHRGPDEQASYIHGNIHFHHLRLSILDISGGKQPMHYLDRYTIIFNGQIYNHQEVRRQLNLQCTTNSDTETILHAYHAEGPAMLKRFDGMFVFAILDRQANELFMARDRAGKKPFYYYRKDRQFVFASELNTLRHLLPLEIQKKNLSHYLQFGSMHRQLTPYQHVHELESGTWIKLHTTSLELKKERWWNIGDYYQQQVADNEAEALVKVDSLLRTAVERRIDSSDLEVGSFLSGGIDSGLITAIASQHTNNLKTFTVAFKGEFNEAPLAKLVADKYKTDHQEIHIGFDSLQTDLETIISNYGEPYFDSSAIPSYYVSKAAKEYVTVILNGDGADELFGGYRRYVPFARYNFFNSSAIVKSVSGMAHRLLPPGNNKKSKYNYIYRLLSLAAKRDSHVFFAASVDIWEGFQHTIRQEEADYLAPFYPLFKQVSESGLSGLKQMMWLDFETSLFDDLLVKMDIATMAHSLEGRSPMLCKDLLEYAPALPDKLKINGTTTKYLLRKLAVKYLPGELLNQPKRGFEIPLKKWVTEDLQSIINDYLTSSGAIYPDIVDKAFVKQLLDGKVSVSDEKRAKMIWALFCMEVWYKKCYLLQ